MAFLVLYGLHSFVVKYTAASVFTLEDYSLTVSFCSVKDQAYLTNSRHILLFSVVKPIGCFRDTGRRAIPQMDGKDIVVRGFYRRRTAAIFKCFAAAARRGYRAFAVQHQGWCATGPRAHVTFRKYGRSNRCRNGRGGPWANDVYFISGELI